MSSQNKKKKKLTIIEAFSGIGSQHQALKNIGIDYDIVATIEWDMNAVFAYDIIHHGKQDVSELMSLTKDEIIDELIKLCISVNGKNPASRLSLNYYSLEALRSILSAFKRTNNLGSITQVKADYFPNDIDVLTYSFPCQNLSACGAWHGYMTGIDKIQKNQSNMIWEIGRILGEQKFLKKNLPKYLLMENVKNITYKVNLDNFEEWKKFLLNLGYINKTFELDALNFGVPQHRKRAFMISTLNDENEHSEKISSYLTSKKIKTIDDKLLLNYLKLDYTNAVYSKEAQTSNPNNTKSREKIFNENDLIYDGNKIKQPYIKTITTKQDRHPNSGVIVYDSLRKDKAQFRYLTPRECFLLMGFPESAFNALLDNNVKVKNDNNLLTIEKLYRLAGNSIVVNILEDIFNQIYQYI